jgi:hypothetical protein
MTDEVLKTTNFSFTANFMKTKEKMYPELDERLMRVN